MNSLLLICVSFIAAALGLGNDTEWEAYKKHYGKKYNEDEELYRKQIWRSSSKFIEEHNANETGFKLEMNHLGDLTLIEYRLLRLGAKYSGNDTKNCGVTFHSQSGTNLPASVDWRNKGYVTPVKNQGSCGSCWAFSATGSLEGQHFKKTGTLVSLSEQELVDCSGGYGNYGCRGGWPNNAFNYIKNNDGINTEAGYPYRAVQQRCQFRSSNVRATVFGLKNIQKYSEQDLKIAVATVGPISVGIDASPRSFQHYRSGVYYEPSCSSTRVNHAVLVVGYGATSTGKKYWLVKNSWGPRWGMSGYIWMARDRNNNCAIASYASYPLVDPPAEADRKFISACEGASKNSGGRLFSHARYFGIILGFFGYYSSTVF